MRQAFGLSLVVAVLVASLLVCSVPARAGDPDIPMYHPHLGSQMMGPGQAAADTQVHRTDQTPDSQSTVVESPASRIPTLWRMLARWMSSHALRAGH